MIINIGWEDFHTRFFLDNMIFVKEHPESFEFITSSNSLVLRCIRIKDNSEEDIIFIKRYLTDKKNLVKVLDFEGYEEEDIYESVEPKEDYIQEVETKEKENDILQHIFFV